MNEAQNYMKESMSNMKEMVDVDRSIGKELTFGDTLVIPISEVKMCFLTGGGEYPVKQKPEEFPFGGVTGGNVTVTPIGFLVVNKNEQKAISLDSKAHTIDRILDKIPDLFKKEEEEEK